MIAKRFAWLMEHPGNHPPIAETRRADKMSALPGRSQARPAAAMRTPLGLSFSVILAAILFAVTGSLSAQVKKGSWTPDVETEDRGYSSISYWTYRDDGVEIGGGRISVEHGKPSWPDSLSDPATFDAATKGRTWRLGKDKWSTLDTQLPLRFGRREVKPGIYYLGARREESGQWMLVFVDPEAVRHGYMDGWAFAARPDEVPVLFSVPLEYARESESVDQLRMQLSLTDRTSDQAKLSIAWGPHRLTTPFRIEMASPTFYKSKP